MPINLVADNAIEAKKKILYVDDDAFAQQVASLALAKSFIVISETSGVNAISKAETESPDLILLDLNMPNIDGYEVLTLIKDHPFLSSIPVMCLSAEQDEKSRARAYVSGAACFIAKPINVTTISDDITKLLLTINKDLIASDGKRFVFIGYNANETEVRIKKDILSEISNGGNTLVISFQDGNSFFKKYNIALELFENGRLIFLQIKPSLIARLPYLENLSSVIDDLKKMLIYESSSYILFFDGPEIILNIGGNDTIKSSLLLNDHLAPNFRAVKYYSRANQNPKFDENLNEMAKLLLGHY